MIQRHVTYLFAGLITAVFFTVSAFFSRNHYQAPLKIRASIPYWDQDNAMKTVLRNPAVFNSVSLFWYFLDESGQIAKYEYAKENSEFIVLARKQGIRVSAVITNLPEASNTTWDSARVENALSPESRPKHISDIKSLILDKGFDGVTIDYESVNGKLKDDFTAFIKELSASLDGENKFVGVALHPKTGSWSSDRRYDFQAWSELGQLADELYIMAYGEHWDGGSPGPIASASWVEKIVNYAKRQNVPLYKFYLGIPLYGYDWSSGQDQAQGLTYADVSKLITAYQITPLWDANAQAPHFSYQMSQALHTVWYENAKSVLGKIELAKSAGFGGVSFWRLGGEDPAIWENLKNP